MLTAIVNALQFPVVVQFAPKPPCHSSHDNAARGMTILFGFSNYHHYADLRLQISDLPPASACNHQSEICNLKSGPC
jgi:hypothetical protein